MVAVLAGAGSKDPAYVLRSLRSGHEDPACVRRRVRAGSKDPAYVLKTGPTY